MCCFPPQPSLTNIKYRPPMRTASPLPLRGMTAALAQSRLILRGDDCTEFLPVHQVVGNSQANLSADIIDGEGGDVVAGFLFRRRAKYRLVKEEMRAFRRIDLRVLTAERFILLGR